MYESPADAVSRQLTAYNARDVDAFAACFRPDVEIVDLPRNLVQAKGLEEVTRLYRNVLDRSPGLRCEVVGRLTAGPFVVDREIVSGLPGGADLHAIAIYEVEDGLIRRIWMVRESFPI